MLVLFIARGYSVLSNFSVRLRRGTCARVRGKKNGLAARGKRNLSREERLKGRARLRQFC